MYAYRTDFWLDLGYGVENGSHGGQVPFKSKRNSTNGLTSEYEALSTYEIKQFFRNIEEFIHFTGPIVNFTSDM